jgi:subtilisin family serine protease
MAGMAWNVRIMPLVALDPDGSGEVATVVKAIRFAVSNGANIINLSLVGYDENDELTEIIRRASQAGVVVVAATGNDPSSRDGLDLDQTPLYPVCADGARNYVLGVSGTDTLDQKMPYANYGRRCTDIVAPSMAVFAAAVKSGYLDHLNGTSLAAPLVSGAAALLKSVHPEWTSQQIRNRLIETADPIEEHLTPEIRGRFGHGRLNVGRALAGGASNAYPAPVLPRAINHQLP